MFCILCVSRHWIQCNNTALLSTGPQWSGLYPTHATLFNNLFWIHWNPLLQKRWCVKHTEERCHCFVWKTYQKKTRCDKKTGIELDWQENYYPRRNANNGGQRQRFGVGCAHCNILSISVALWSSKREFEGTGTTINYLLPYELWRDWIIEIHDPSGLWVGGGVSYGSWFRVDYWPLWLIPPRRHEWIWSAILI